MSIGQSQIYLLVSPGMKIHHSISKFLSLGVNKKRLVELILKSIIDKRENLGSPVVYFPIVYGTLSIRWHRRHLSLSRPKFFTSSFIDNQTGTFRKIYYINSTKLSPVFRKAVPGYIHSQETMTYWVFFGKEKNCARIKLVKQDKFVNLFADLGNKPCPNEPTLKNYVLYMDNLDWIQLMM